MEGNMGNVAYLRIAPSEQAYSREQEEWRPITEPDFADVYMVSSKGRMARVLRGSRVSADWYPAIILSKKGIAYRAFRVHQLVAWAFNGPQPEGTVINHRDCDKTNTEPTNLEYVTQLENVRHGIRMRRRVINKNPMNGQFKAVLTVDQVGEIKSLLNAKTPHILIAADYGVTAQAIRHIKAGRNWNRVPAKP